MSNQFGVRDAHKMFSNIYKESGEIGLNLVLVRKNDNKVFTLIIQDREILRDAHSLKKLTDSLSGVEYKKLTLVAECWAHTPDGKVSVAIFVEYQQTGIKCWMSSAKGKTLGKLEPMKTSIGFADSYFMRLVA